MQSLPLSTIEGNRTNNLHQFFSPMSSYSSDSTTYHPPSEYCNSIPSMQNEPVPRPKRDPSTKPVPPVRQSECPYVESGELHGKDETAHYPAAEASGRSSPGYTSLTSNTIEPAKIYTVRSEDYDGTARAESVANVSSRLSGLSAQKPPPDGIYENERAKPPASSTSTLAKAADGRGEGNEGGENSKRNVSNVSNDYDLLVDKHGREIIDNRQEFQPTPYRIAHNCIGHSRSHMQIRGASQMSGIASCFGRGYYYGSKGRASASSDRYTASPSVSDESETSSCGSANRLAVAMAVLALILALAALAMVILLFLGVISAKEDGCSCNKGEKRKDALSTSDPSTVCLLRNLTLFLTALAFFLLSGGGGGGGGHTLASSRTFCLNQQKLLLRPLLDHYEYNTQCECAENSFGRVKERTLPAHHVKASIAQKLANQRTVNITINCRLVSPLGSAQLRQWPCT